MLHPVSKIKMVPALKRIGNVSTKKTHIPVLQAQTVWKFLKLPNASTPYARKYKQSKKMKKINMKKMMTMISMK